MTDLLTPDQVAEILSVSRARVIAEWLAAA
jgi:hypothetical protein